MDRAEKIADKARDASTWCMNDVTDMKEYWRNISGAAVRAAYEIDGVDDLLKAAEAMVQPIRDADEFYYRENVLRIAAARVREAMGGGA